MVPSERGKLAAFPCFQSKLHTSVLSIFSWFQNDISIFPKKSNSSSVFVPSLLKNNMLLQPTPICTHHTSFPHQRGWSSCVHKEDRWPGPLGSSVQYQGSTPPQHHCLRVCLPSRSSSPYPRQGSRCRSSCWDQLWRLGSPSWCLEQTRERPGIPKQTSTTKRSLSRTKQQTSGPKIQHNTQC